MTIDCLVGIFRPGGGVLREQIELLLDACGATHGRRILGSSRQICFGVGTLVAEAGTRTAANCFESEDLMWAIVGDGMSAKPYLSSLAPSAQGDWAQTQLTHDSRRFALLHWDGSSEELLCLRDPLGMEPLYYASLPGGGVAVASRSTALAQLPDVSREPDIASYAEAVLLLPERPGATMFRAVRRLPRATALHWSARGHSLSKYWSVSDCAGAGMAAVSSEALKATFEAAVERCTFGAPGVAVTVSGGLDSTSSFAVASQQRDGDVLAVSAVFPGDIAASEDEYRDAALQSIRHRRSCCITPSPSSSIEEALRYSDYPKWIPFSSIVRASAMAAKREGAQVLVTGEYGDFVAGAVRHPAQWLARRGRYADAWEVLRWRAGRSRATLSLMKQILRANSNWSADWFARYSRLTQTRLAILRTFSPQVCREFGLVDQLLDHARNLGNSWSSFSDAAEYFFDQQILRGAGSCWLAERMAGIRIEHPFAYPPLVRLSSSMSFEQRWHAGLTRAAFRQALGESLPPAIRDRSTKSSLVGPHGRYWQSVLSNVDWQAALAPLQEILGFSPKSVARLDFKNRLEGRKFEFEMFVCAEFLRMYHTEAASNSGATRLDRDARGRGRTT